MALRAQAGAKIGTKKLTMKQPAVTNWVSAHVCSHDVHSGVTKSKRLFCCVVFGGDTVGTPNGASVPAKSVRRSGGST